MSRAFSVVIPTYNEHDCIVPLLERLSRALAGLSYEIVFIDDNSGDGTAAQINSLVGKYPVRVIVRKDKRGLASAVIDGFSYAMQDIIVVMDADLQHPPEVVPALVKAIENGADVAVASRYIPGGGNEGWSKSRQFISNGAILLAHLLLPQSRKVKDPMSGFFAIRRQPVARLKLEPRGYKILLEIITMGRFLTVTEVPFKFQVRELGASKLNMKQQTEYLKHLLSLMRRSGEMARFFKFVLVGASGVVVNAGLYWILTRMTSLTGSLDIVAVAISAETSIINNFILNNFFTFADRRQKGLLSFFGKLLKFNLVSLIGVGIQLGMFFILTRYLGFVQPYDIIALLIAIVIAMAWNFLSNNWWTWKR
jgi:dolichol-phosphate mannosyltransferase